MDNENEEDEEEEEISGDEESRGESIDSNDSPDLEKCGLSKAGYKKINGVVPKDLESKKEMMSFIVYPHHLESTCKLLSCSKIINFSEGPHDKNRIYLSGATIMSTKLVVSLAQSKKICALLQDEKIFERQIKRINFLERP